MDGSDGNGNGDQEMQDDEGLYDHQGLGQDNGNGMDFMPKINYDENMEDDVGHLGSLSSIKGILVCVLTNVQQMDSKIS